MGLDISSSAVKLVELAEAGSNQYRLERYAIEPLPRDAVTDGNIASLEAVADAIRRAWKRLGSSTRQVALALPAAAVITKKIMLPAGLRELEMEVQVESEANQYIPFAIDEVNLDFQVLGPSPGSAEEVDVLIAASRKEKVEDRVAAAEAAGLKALVMDVESFASQAAFELIKKRLPDAGRGKIVALVDLGAQVMKVTILRDQNVLYSREQAFGGNQLTQDISRNYGMSTEEAEAAKRSSSLPEDYEHELLKPFTESVALEVSRALQFFFTSTQFNQVDNIVLSGGCAVIPGIDQVVASRTQVPTKTANPFVGMSLSQRVRPKNLAADAPALMVACGLALRRFDA
ncbi:MAG: pilus assembly protein PilM [Candidatus Dactylopiibacterium carminicum]|uniref:Pilus assembly protein PilM n=1 Tax=Candidatus Dactylopiibacterium carminicum TaxID=857335 RepID=A0A272EQL8_9RHOO|nr:pilus assembly protein PilM [Candidatus Dactylopiibacterium carminicum]PAS92371.1 MAG: pilus assembly protein PilM [Candidatus Dactylopiibacterium carminicum]PAS95817.1 MAG: pilus assembly protein PilM [Candidatus Dactylopiibacterium carminicum]PAS98383.1 MAG: pilus assembly protein PilM [Candidatus Dactylopiibacterium carminicum]